MHNCNPENTTDISYRILVIKSMLLMLSDNFSISKGSVYILKELAQVYAEIDISDLICQIDELGSEYNSNAGAFIHNFHREILETKLSLQEKSSYICRAHFKI